MSELNNAQLMILMQNGPLFDRIERLLPPELCKQLESLQIRAGQVYNAGDWEVPEAEETFTNPDGTNPPTKEEAEELLGAVNKVLSDSKEKNALQDVIKELGFIPSALYIHQRNNESKDKKEVANRTMFKVASVALGIVVNYFNHWNVAA